MATKLAGRGTGLRGRRRRREDAPRTRPALSWRRAVARAQMALTGLAKPIARVATRLHLPLPRAWRRRPMRAADALEILGALSLAGVRHWVVGGWGVDALLGEETRQHDDLDLAVSASQVDRRRREVTEAQRALEALGYRFERDAIHLGAWFPERLTHLHRSGRRVDLLPIDERDPEHFATGRIGARTVPCLSAEVQLRLHGGYPRTAADRHDIAALRAEFGLQAPRADRKMEPGWR